MTSEVNDIYERNIGLVETNHFAEDRNHLCISSRFYVIVKKKPNLLPNFGPPSACISVYGWLHLFFSKDLSKKYQSPTFTSGTLQPSTEKRHTMDGIYLVLGHWPVCEVLIRLTSPFSDRKWNFHVCFVASTWPQHHHRFISTTAKLTKPSIRTNTKFHFIIFTFGRWCTTQQRSTVLASENDAQQRQRLLCLFSKNCRRRTSPKRLATSYRTTSIHRTHTHAPGRPIAHFLHRLPRLFRTLHHTLEGINSAAVSCRAAFERRPTTRTQQNKIENYFVISKSKRK